MSCPQIDLPGAATSLESTGKAVLQPVVKPLDYVLPDTLRNWPYKRSISPHYSEAENEALRWLMTLVPVSSAGLESFKKNGIGLLCALTFPKASHYVLRSCCEMMILFWFLDEYTDTYNTEDARMACDMTMDAILHPEKPRPAGEPIFGEIARQFWKRASAGAPQATRERFVSTWHDYLDSVVIQASRRDNSRYICTIEEYMVSRRDNVGFYPCLPLMELALEVDIPQEIIEHPTIVALVRDATDMILLCNDMCSYKKEVLTDSADYNAVTIVMHSNKTDVVGGIQWVSDCHDELVEHFLQLRDEVYNKVNFPSFGDAIDRQIEAYVDGLGEWVRGNDDWGFECGRYFGKDGFEIQRTRKVVVM